MVSNVYCNTKNNIPYLKSVCEVAENGVKSITSAAFYSALPIIGKLEPQSKSIFCSADLWSGQITVWKCIYQKLLCPSVVSMANDLACKGLDKIEKTLPILHKPSDQVFSKLHIKIVQMLSIRKVPQF